MKCEAFMSLHSLYEPSVWRCNHFLKINPESNSISIVQIKKILWRDLLDLQACNREMDLNQDHSSCEKVGKICSRES